VSQLVVLLVLLIHIPLVVTLLTLVPFIIIVGTILCQLMRLVLF